MRVLTVDDEPAILRLLGAILARGGYDVVTAADARSAKAVFEHGCIDAVILDLGLPDQDGLEVIASIRSASNVPLIVVTARSEVSEKVAALDLGADDYVTKPFDGDELLARLRSAIRRIRPVDSSAGLMICGPIVMDIARHEVMVRGKLVALRPKEFAVLRALVEGRGRIVSHAALLERVWGKAHLSDVDYLRVAVRSLRLKIEDDPSHPQIIRNEPAIGYRLSDQVQGLQ